MTNTRKTGPLPSSAGPVERETFPRTSPSHLPNTSSATPKVKPPINLPRFTFIHAPPAYARAIKLSEAIADRDSRVGLFDFEEPLRRATMELFFGGQNPNIDLLDPDTRCKRFETPGFHHGRETPYRLDPASVLWGLRAMLEKEMHPAILASIAIAELEDGGQSLFYERFVYRDANYNLVCAFAEKYTPQKCLQISFEPMPAPDKMPALWLSHGLSIETMLTQLERDLNP